MRYVLVLDKGKCLRVRGKSATESGDQILRELTDAEAAHPQNLWPPQPALIRIGGRGGHLNLINSREMSVGDMFVRNADKEEIRINRLT